VAKEFGVSQPTVVNLAREAGLPVGVQTPVLREAVEAGVLAARGKRAALAEQALDEAKYFLDELRAPETIYHFDAKMGAWNEKVIPSPLQSSRQSKMISFGIAVDKAMAIAAYDSEGPTASKIAIISLVDQLRDEAGNRVEPIAVTPAKQV
jgi:hypothetical protein